MPPTQKTAAQPPPAPKAEPVVHETYDLRGVGEKFQIVEIAYAEGKYAEEVIFTTDVPAIAGKAWVLLTRRKLAIIDPTLPVPPLDLKALQ